eukprot:scaffold23011_cov126-Isochrysis_galbana.AAC.3
MPLVSLLCAPYCCRLDSSTTASASCSCCSRACALCARPPQLAPACVSIEARLLCLCVVKQ